MIEVITAPQLYSTISSGYQKYTCIFLAGTIDMGDSVDWQTVLANDLGRLMKEKNIDANVLIFNPRRKNWDSSWEQKFDNPQFNEQVNWELDAITKADIVVFNLLPNSKSPISLLELGFCSYKQDNCLILCPDEFYRKGNVVIFASRHAMPVFTSYETLLANIVRKIANR